MLKLLIAGNIDFSDEELDRIKKMGYNITAVEREDTTVIPEPWSYDVIICNWLFMHHDITKFKSLKAVQLLSAGLDRMPTGYALENNILIENARGVYSIPIAEFTVMTVLDEYKRSDHFYAAQKEHKWVKERSLEELSDKKICIIGTGSVGTEVAKRFSAFTGNVVGIDILSAEKPYFLEVFGLDRIETELSDSDVVILTLPLSENTYHMFNGEMFSHMKENSIFINVARGGLVDESALKASLDCGKFRCVILDTFESEPLDEEYWGWNYKELRIIPHNTFVSNMNSIRLKKIIMDNLSNWSAKLHYGQDYNKDGNE